MERLANAAALACVLAVLGGWMFATPDLPRLTLDGAAPTLPFRDAPCAGNILQAEPGLQDAAFQGSVILMCGEGEAGTVGFILNRSAGRPARDALAGAPATLGALRAGGPVAPSQVSVVYRDGAGGLRYTNVALQALFPETGFLAAPRVDMDRVLLVAAGYAGWLPGQLEQEIQAGVWRLTDQDAQEAVQRSMHQTR